ncbi:putative vacuolar protein sorting protein Vps66 [Talaromyces proteolyticus]|uniref:Vacuolar protein sorting protein Vps66 n=1 Tax=Talaromyces proteolyticus TaxID=1131652 RepID=A0AAD4KIN9_9EURO|nr:putative vacuolar protein sorting protein Vps66 [Talaromyces proteolyticus]KAH8690230.1 putative vacuolar protein sorting protein Vps66 [Talaromyces proteolyticus]
MEKFSQFRDRGSGIAPFLPIPTQPSGYALPLHIFLFCFRLPLLIFVCLSYFLVLQYLPIGSLGKKASLWCILGVPSLWWIDLQVDGVKRGHLASQRSRLPLAKSIIASSFTSPIDAIYLAAIFDPIFTASYPDTSKVQQLSLLGAILRSFAEPELTPPVGADLVNISDLTENHPSRPIVVFAECTTTNGRGILPLSRSLASVPPRTKIYPISLRYTEPDITTPVPHCYTTFLWNLLSKPTHFIRVRVAEHVSSSSKASPEGRGTTSNFFDDEDDDSSATLLDESSASETLTNQDRALLDYVGESLARLGRVKRVGLGVQEKRDFVRMWTKQQRR